MDRLKKIIAVVIIILLNSVACNMEYNDQLATEVNTYENN